MVRRSNQVHSPIGDASGAASVFIRARYRCCIRRVSVQSSAMSSPIHSTNRSRSKLHALFSRPNCQTINLRLRREQISANGGKRTIMPRGGKRPGAGRPPKLPMKQRMMVGAACERDWLELYFGGAIRPYSVREEIIDRHVKYIEWRYGEKVTPRAVASWWSMFRKSQKS